MVLCRSVIRPGVGGLPLILKAYTGSTIMNILIVIVGLQAFTGESDFLWQRIHSSRQQEKQQQMAIPFAPPMQLVWYHFAIS